MLKNKNIVLIGIMGSGKTTISKLLAQKLERPIIDIDDYIVEKYQMTIPQMFDISENYFRERETICCQEVGQLEGYVLSTGGGVIKNQANIDALRKNGIIIYLDRPIPLILEDVETSTRPLLKNGAQELYKLHDQRHQLYLDACDHHMINDVPLDEMVQKIVKKIGAR